MRFSRHIPRIALLLVCALFFLATGCFKRAEIGDRKLLEGKKTVYIYAPDDPMTFKENVRKGLARLGFSVVDVKSEADLVVDYRGNCGWDLLHYTCKLINFFVTDRASGEIVIKASFQGSTPLSVEKILKDMFTEIETKIRMESHGQTAPNES